MTIPASFRVVNGMIVPLSIPTTTDNAPKDWTGCCRAARRLPGEED